MIKALLLSLSLGTFLSYLDAKVLPAPEGHRSNTEPYRIEKRSSFNARTVSIWLEGAKNNTDSAMEALTKSKAKSWLKGELNEAKEALLKVSTTSSKSLPDDIRNALFLAALVLNDMLSEYNTTGERISDTELFNAIYFTAGACIDLMFALGEALIDCTLGAAVFEKIKVLQDEHLSAPGGTEFPNRILELAKEVLQETKNHHYVQNTV